MTYLSRLDDSIAHLTAAGEHFEVAEATINGLVLKVYKNTPASLRSQ